MGCRPVWTFTRRVTGIEVLPPRLAVRASTLTWRISRLFPISFRRQIALIDAATRAVAAREEAVRREPLAARAPCLRARRASLASSDRTRRLRAGVET